ncbi:MAG: hypothetical protein OXF50_24305 [Caldilineaceae bacterium]|nr:hypothetical protein [Caldilineaceae bacterium]
MEIQLSARSAPDAGQRDAFDELAPEDEVDDERRDEGSIPI